MIELIKQGVYLIGGAVFREDDILPDIARVNEILRRSGSPHLLTGEIDKDEAKNGTMASQIIRSHNQARSGNQIKLKFDSLASHDITYVGIIQTAQTSGLREFPLPYVLTNCHNSLCAVGGTINEDDHMFGLSAARKYGGIYVPAHLAVIHQYVREMMAACGRMILGSDSHTRYGALGAMGIGEGGGEIAKQLLGQTYDLPRPEVIAVYLEGKPAPGVGPQDVALAIIKALFPESFATNKVLEFIGPGIENLSVDFRNGIDVMTTETTCLSSIWQTDEKVAEYYRIHGRPDAYAKLLPAEGCYYEGMARVDLSRIEPMIALPMHPSNVWPISELTRHGRAILREVEEEAKKQLENKELPFRLSDKLEDGRLKFAQGVVVGCSGGTFENIMTISRMLAGKGTGDDVFSLSVYPASQPIFLELVRKRAIEELMIAGAVIKTAFCGPCFGAGDTPANDTISARHATRNFPNREGSIPADGQIASVALMDARSIAATAINGGLLTAATELDLPEIASDYYFDARVYKNRVYQGFGNPHRSEELRFGPNIVPWPKMPALSENIILQVVSVIHDPVTTTDELIPSGQTSSYRSNPLKLAEFTLFRKDPLYVSRAKAVYELELNRRELTGSNDLPQALGDIYRHLFPDQPENHEIARVFWRETMLGSVIFARKPGDGSAREQAASCQKVLGGLANIAIEYATKRYRSNLINWGILPFTIAPDEGVRLAAGDYVYIPKIRQVLSGMLTSIPSKIVKPGETIPITLTLDNISRDDRDIILAGCLMNYYNLAMTSNTIARP